MPARVRACAFVDLRQHRARLRRASTRRIRPASSSGRANAMRARSAVMREPPRRDAVAEAAVDRALGRGEDRGRFVALARVVVHRGHHLREHAAAPMRRQHRHPRHRGRREQPAARHRELERVRARHADHLAGLERDPRAVELAERPAARRVRAVRRAAEARAGRRPAVRRPRRARWHGSRTASARSSPDVAGGDGLRHFGAVARAARKRTPTYDENPANSSTTATDEDPAAAAAGEHDRDRRRRDPHELEPRLETGERAPAHGLRAVALQEAVERDPTARGRGRDRSPRRRRATPAVVARGEDERQRREAATRPRASTPRAPSCAGTAR